MLGNENTTTIHQSKKKQLSNRITDTNLQTDRNIINNTSQLNAVKASGLKAFLTSKAGIITISIVSSVIVAAIVIPVAITQANKNKDDIEEDKTDIVDNSTDIGDINTDVTDNNNHTFHSHFDEDLEHTQIIAFEEETPESEEQTDPYYNIDPQLVYHSGLLSLSPNNLLKSEVLSQTVRTVPTEVKTESELPVLPSYGGDNSLAQENHDVIYEENEVITSGTTTYDEIDSDGKLYLNNVYIGKTLYKHKFSIGLSGGNISDDEKAITKKITINPNSYGNYITGLYAPAGEVVKVEFDDTELNNIGGSVEFVIGQSTQSGGVSICNKNIGLKRLPILVNKLKITKNPGYIGSCIGGPIYISNPPKRKKFTVIISNAVPYKHLIVGSTTKEEFEAMDSYTAPFFELDVRDSIRYSGPLSIVEGLDYDNLVKNLIFWDKCVRTSRLIPNQARKNMGIHFLYDPYISAGGALAVAFPGANWCQVPLSFKMALDYEITTMYGPWGHIHELNHHYQSFGFNPGFPNEITNNVVNIIEYIIYTQISGLRNEFSNSELTKVSGNSNNMNPEYALNSLLTSPPNSANELRFYLPILFYFGYDKFIEVCQKGNGYGGVDIFYKALTEVLHYDFSYYVERVLNLVVSESVKEQYRSLNYPLFVPIMSIYQTGIYYTIDSVEHFSNTTLPYRIPLGGPTKLNFEDHLIFPEDFWCHKIIISEPKYGRLEEISDLIFLYTPDENHIHSGIIHLTVNLINHVENININVKMGLNFEVDTSLSTETVYIYDSFKYTNLEDAINSNFQNYSDIKFTGNKNGRIYNLAQGNIAIWEGKFKIDDDGYKYIVIKGGGGQSLLYAKINEEPDYYKIGSIAINQNSYLFNGLSSYEIHLNKGDIVYFKYYLLSSQNGAGAYIGISKIDQNNQVRTLSSSDIIGIKGEFDKIYTFYSGDPYKTDKLFDSLSFFDYSQVVITSPNFEPWDSNYILSKMVDEDSTTYMHTKQTFRISQSAPLVLNFDLGKKYNFDQIIFIKGNIKSNNLPKVLTLYTSDDGTNWVQDREYTSISNAADTSSIFELDQLIYTRYIRMDISSQMYGYYVAITSVQFIEKDFQFYQKEPEYAQIVGTNIEINSDNFPYFGHSYILNVNSFMSFEIHEVTEIKIKVCNKLNSKVKLFIDKDAEGEIIEISQSDELEFPIEKKNLVKGTHHFKIVVTEGKLDFEYILYKH